MYLTACSRLNRVKKSIYVAYTGGTIGMQRSADGYRPAAGYLEARLATMAELNAPEMPRVTLHEYAPLLDSAELSPRDWQRIGEDIAARHHDFDGFVVLHGTDTMAYTASALSFTLQHLAKPVILTGSQIPLAEVRSDAKGNLITSLLLAAHHPMTEVGLYFGGLLLRGNRARKVSSHGFGAFESPNALPLATVGVDITFSSAVKRAQPTAPLQLQPLADVQLGALRLFPGLSETLLDRVLRDPLQGLVLETYGSGNAPQTRSFLRVLNDATARGVVVVNCTQCLRGAVDMAGYATGRALADAGVTSGFDLTPEAALTKLYYLFSQGLSAADVRVQMQTDLRGELSASR